MKTRIIGCGNPDRMDDAAGVLVAQRLRQMGIAAEIQTGGAFELVESWNEDDQVILIDAVSTGSSIGTIHVWQGRPPLVPSNPQLSSHGFGVAEAINLAQVLGRLPRDLRVYGIEGKHFGLGETVSPEILAAFERVANQIAHSFAHAADIKSAESQTIQVSG